MNAPAERAVVLVENKLIGIDMILPVMMELKAENPDLDIEFLFLRKAFMSKVKENYVLWEGMKQTGHISALIDAGYGPASPLGRATSMARLATQTAKALTRRTALFFRRDFASFPVWPLALAVRRGGGALFGFPMLSYPMATIFAKHMLTRDADAVNQPDHHLIQNDRRLLCHPLQEAIERQRSNAPMAAIGTPRQFPCWLQFLDAIEADAGIRDFDGNQIDVEAKKNLLMFYAGNHALPSLDGPTACRDQFVKSLEAVRVVDRNLCILIKPHPICDLDELLHEIKPFSDLEIQIIAAHPQNLAKHANACLFSHGSSLIDDMYIAGIPVIETSLYIPEIANSAGSLYPNRGRIASCTQEEIENALRQVLFKPESLPTPETEHLFWPKVPHISDVLWKHTV